MKKKLTFLLVSFLCTANFAKAQNWGGGIDDDWFNWGFQFQYVVSEYKLTKAKNWRDSFLDPETGQYVTDRLNAVSSPTSPGFGVGFVLNLNLQKHVDLRFTPSLVFNDRLVRYDYVTPGDAAFTHDRTVEREVKATMVDFPVGFKVKSDRLLNFRAYMLGGLKYSVDLASNKKTNDVGAAAIDRLLKNKRSFLSYEAGLGFDIYFEYFKMSPEVKLSYSFNDVLKHDLTPYATPIEKAKLRHFTFSLFFE
ncbi:MAG: PorT family protein [Flavobacterium sp.]|nr:MAG: PorT family protein [Flavobacterium sp.]